MKRQLSLLGLVVLLAGCGAAIVEPPPPCSSVAPSGMLEPACTPPGLTLSPVGSWEGTLTTTAGGKGTEPFTAEISLAPGSSDSYTGVFAVGETVYNVTGFYSGTNSEGEAFTFQTPLEKIQPTVSPVEFYGMIWAGQLTETTYSGGWFFNSESANRTPAGEFTLERC